MHISHVHGLMWLKIFFPGSDKENIAACPVMNVYRAEYRLQGLVQRCHEKILSRIEMSKGIDHQNGIFLHAFGHAFEAFAAHQVGR